MIPTRVLQEWSSSPWPCGQGDVGADARRLGAGTHDAGAWCTGSSQPCAISRQYWSGVGSVTERKIAPLVPPRLSVSAGRRLLATRGHQLTLGELLPAPRTGSLVYGMGKIDTWVLCPIGTLSRLSAGPPVIDFRSPRVGGSVVVHRDPVDVFEMGPKPYLVLPPCLPAPPAPTGPIGSGSPRNGGPAACSTRPDRDPAVQGRSQGQRRPAPQLPRGGRGTAENFSPPCAACTSTPSRTA